jgi:hypothetical protein
VSEVEGHISDIQIFCSLVIIRFANTTICIKIQVVTLLNLDLGENEKLG